MKQEDLLKDLCARLPYGVRMSEIEPINDIQSNLTLYSVTNKTSVICITPSEGVVCSSIDAFKPYLFPLSSMTEEQKIECFKGTPLEIDKYGDIAVKDDFYGGSQYTDLEIYLEVIDWLNKNHFDYRGLIPKGLAIDATGLNIY